MVDPQLRLKLQKKYQNEQVFCVPFDKARSIASGFTPVEMDLRTEYNTLAKWESHGKFILRYEAEYNNSLLQLIPYTVLISKDHERVFVAKRTAGDSRLVSNYSLGFGGHINPIDVSYVVRSAALRELHEELNIQKMSPAVFLGYIRDNDSETSEHLGFAYLSEASRIKVRETENMSGDWMGLEELVDKYYKFESWSKFLIDYMFVTTRNGKLFPGVDYEH